MISNEMTAGLYAGISAHPEAESDLADDRLGSIARNAAAFL